MDREQIEAVRELSREVERDGRTLLWAVMSLQDDENAVRTFRKTGNAMVNLSERVGVVLDELEAQERRIEDLQAAAGLVVYELGGYYFEQGDSELEALNRLRLELGLEPQKPKHERDG